MLSRIQRSGACLSIALAVGCGSSASPGDAATSAGGRGANGGAGGAGGSVTSISGAGGEAQCKAPGYPSHAPAIEIDEVDAVLRDPSGAPVPNLAVQVCGLDICVNGSTNALGKTTVTPRAKLLSPAFKYGDGFDFAKLAAPLVEWLMFATH